MQIEAIDWGVVVVGAWNRAILTPDGIRKRLFELPEDSPVGIEIAMDRPGAFRVSHKGTIVEPTSRSLSIFGEISDLESLVSACQIASKALTAIPETPVSAVGVNFRYRTDEMSDTIMDKVGCPLDDTLSDGKYVIASRSTRRTIKIENGVLNLEIIQGENSSGAVMLNFHLDSDNITELTEWLLKITRFEEITKDLLMQIGFIND